MNLADLIPETVLKSELSKDIRLLSPGFTTLAKDAEVSEYANFKEDCLEILTHLDDDKMALRDLDKNTPVSIRLSSC